MDARQQFGLMGEELVAQWLEQTQGHQILHRRWRCRWGELDLITCDRTTTLEPTLAFTEVKTRSAGNWDADGLLAVGLTKQIKLWKSAGVFLASHPTLANLPCRFDVALVSCQVLPTAHSAVSAPEAPIQLGQPVHRQGYQLTIQSYLTAAFEQLD